MSQFLKTDLILISVYVFECMYPSVYLLLYPIACMHLSMYLWTYICLFLFICPMYLSITCVSISPIASVSLEKLTDSGIYSLASV